jgi:hypothetical protein
MHEKFHTGNAGTWRKLARLWSLALLVVLAATAGLDARQGGQPGSRVPLLAAGAAATQTQVVDEGLGDMISMYVSVTDRRGNAIAGLTAANFVIWEDDVEQNIAEFLMDTAPISLGVVFGPNIPIGNTIPTFLKSSAPNTEFFLVGNDTVVAPFSTDPRKAPRVIAQNDMEIFPSGGRDAMRIGLDVLTEASAYVRRVMLVVGRANRANPVATPAFGNGVTYDSLANSASKGNMQIYTIIVSGRAANVFAGLPEASINPTGRPNAPGVRSGLPTDPSGIGMSDINDLGQFFEETQDSIALDGLAALSGGRSYLIQNTETGTGGQDTLELEAVADEIARSLRVQYRIGYRPKNTEKDGKWRAIRVTLVDVPKEVPTKLNLWTKTGYYAAKPPKKK